MLLLCICTYEIVKSFVTFLSGEEAIWGKSIDTTSPHGLIALPVSCM